MNRDFEKALKSTVTASLVVALLYHPANLVLLQAKHAALFTESHSIIKNNAVCLIRQTALFAIMQLIDAFPVCIRCYNAERKQ